MGTKIRLFKPDNINDKKPSPLTFFAKFQEATGLLTFYGLPTRDKLRKRATAVNSQVHNFCEPPISAPWMNPAQFFPRFAAWISLARAIASSKSPRMFISPIRSTSPARVSAKSGCERGPHKINSFFLIRNFSSKSSSASKPVASSASTSPIRKIRTSGNSPARRKDVSNLSAAPKKNAPKIRKTITPSGIWVAGFPPPAGAPSSAWTCVNSDSRATKSADARMSDAPTAVGKSMQTVSAKAQRKTAVSLFGQRFSHSQ
jgi:hypothetical protein